MKTNICILGLAPTFTKCVAKDLADSLDMYYADVNDLLRFDMFDLKETEKKCGKEYLQKQESLKIKTVSSYDNTVITVDYGSLNNNKNLDYIKKGCLVVYLKLTENEFLNKLNYDILTKSQLEIEKSLFFDRDFICGNISDIKINCKNLKDEDIVELIMSAIGNYYK